MIEIAGVKYSVRAARQLLRFLSRSNGFSYVSTSSGPRQPQRAGFTTAWGPILSGQVRTG